MCLLMLINELIKHYQMINRSLFYVNWNAYKCNQTFNSYDHAFKSNLQMVLTDGLQWLKD